MRIGAACRAADISYSRFMNGLKLAGIELNRKVLSDLALSDPASFTLLINQAKDAQAKHAEAHAAPPTTAPEPA